jgi:hypothetical protein
MGYAIIQKSTGIVMNIVAWDGQSAWSPGNGFEVVAIGNSGAGIGWTYANGTFQPPTE